MKHSITFLLLTSVFVFTLAPVQASQDHVGHDQDSAHVEISADMARQTGIVSKQAGSGTLVRTLPSYGRLTVDPDHLVHIRARFPGQVIEVNVSLGDRVAAGDPLVTIESNDSLQPYTVRSPMAGTVLERHANKGGLATGQSLFTIATLDPLLAELQIFPGRRRDVQAGQMVQVDTGHSQIAAPIRDILSTSTDSPYVIARVAIDNSEGLLSPGRLVSAGIVIERIDAALVVENQALQTIDGSLVVFVQRGDVYEPRSLELGSSDGQVTEVLSGLSAGERYVVENSYLIKADLEKSGAAHAH